LSGFISEVRIAPVCDVFSKWNIQKYAPTSFPPEATIGKPVLIRSIQMESYLGLLVPNAPV